MDRVDRWVFLHRRLLAAALAGLAVLMVVSALRDVPAGVPVVVAGDDLPSGHVLSARDLEVRHFPADVVPAGSPTDPGAVMGRSLAGPVRAGEPLTDRRLLDGDDLSGYGIDGPAVLSTVRLADPGSLAVVGVGDTVDVIAVDPRGESEPRVVVAAARVAALPAADPDRPGTGAVVTLATTEEAAPALAAAGLNAELTVVARR
ncbi:SAF domain-containing protein [Aeromicrobium marinum]|uniref:SAF domain-containing protein n=1 Tax=Aeromicrobium marinum TaxID=219314 RepID=UPI00058C5853|nr:SAF domain-containing protein [Aeromicrobium marinum]